MEKCLRCNGEGIDPEFSGECRVCKGSGEKQPDIVLEVKKIIHFFDFNLGGKENGKMDT